MTARNHIRCGCDQPSDQPCDHRTHLGLFWPSFLQAIGQLNTQLQAGQLNTQLQAGQLNTHFQAEQLNTQLQAGQLNTQLQAEQLNTQLQAGRPPRVGGSEKVKQRLTRRPKPTRNSKRPP